ncbi:hypothetical protein DIPPA_15973 [Diplonema papillatum]|nr:hypothetical protein DIPPA_15973 [Diplonema papillatum]
MAYHVPSACYGCDMTRRRVPTEVQRALIDVGLGDYCGLVAHVGVQELRAGGRRLLEGLGMKPGHAVRLLLRLGATKYGCAAAGGPQAAPASVANGPAQRLEFTPHSAPAPTPAWTPVPNDVAQQQAALALHQNHPSYQHHQQLPSPGGAGTPNRSCEAQPLTQGIGHPHPNGQPNGTGNGVSPSEDAYSNPLYAGLSQRQQSYRREHEILAPRAPPHGAAEDANRPASPTLQTVSELLPLPAGLQRQAEEAGHLPPRNGANQTPHGAPEPASQDRHGQYHEPQPVPQRLPVDQLQGQHQQHQAAAGAWGQPQPSSDPVSYGPPPQAAGTENGRTSQPGQPEGRDQQSVPQRSPVEQLQVQHQQHQAAAGAWGQPQPSSDPASYGQAAGTENGRTSQSGQPEGRDQQSSQPVPHRPQDPPQPPREPEAASQVSQPTQQSYPPPHQQQQQQQQQSLFPHREQSWQQAPQPTPQSYPQRPQESPQRALDPVREPSSQPAPQPTPQSHSPDQQQQQVSHQIPQPQYHEQARPVHEQSWQQSSQPAPLNYPQQSLDAGLRGSQPAPQSHFSGPQQQIPHQPQQQHHDPAGAPQPTQQSFFPHGQPLLQRPDDLAQQQGQSQRHVPQSAATPYRPQQTQDQQLTQSLGSVAQQVQGHSETQAGVSQQSQQQAAAQPVYSQSQELVHQRPLQAQDQQPQQGLHVQHQSAVPVAVHPSHGGNVSHEIYSENRAPSPSGVDQARLAQHQNNDRTEVARADVALHQSYATDNAIRGHLSTSNQQEWVPPRPANDGRPGVDTHAAESVQSVPYPSVVVHSTLPTGSLGQPTASSVRLEDATAQERPEAASVLSAQADPMWRAPDRVGSQGMAPAHGSMPDQANGFANHPPVPPPSSSAPPTQGREFQPSPAPSTSHSMPSTTPYAPEQLSANNRQSPPPPWVANSTAQQQPSALYPTEAPSARSQEHPVSPPYPTYHVGASQQQQVPHEQYEQHSNNPTSRIVDLPDVSQDDDDLRAAIDKCAEATIHLADQKLGLL